MQHTVGVETDGEQHAETLHLKVTTNHLLTQGVARRATKMNATSMVAIVTSRGDCAFRDGKVLRWDDSRSQDTAQDPIYDSRDQREILEYHAAAITRVSDARDFMKRSIARHCPPVIDTRHLHISDRVCPRMLGETEPGIACRT